jgi:hypothetical protein
MPIGKCDASPGRQICVTLHDWKSGVQITSVMRREFFLNPSLFAICTKYNKQMAWFIDRDGGEESSVALFCIQKVQ